MSSLFAGLHIGQRALQAQQLALEITQRNIANANTPYYARQRVNLIPGEPIGWEGAAPGGGVLALLVDSFRNRFLDCRVTQELQAKGENEAVLSALSQVEPLLNPGESQGLDAAISEFFAGFDALASLPEDMSLRRQVLVRGQELAREFKRVYEGLQSIQSSNDRAVADMVGEINMLTSNIAELNSRIAQAHSLKSGDEFTLRDQRQQLLDRLSELVDTSYYETESGAVTVATVRGTVLLAEDHPYALAAMLQPGTAYNQIMAGGRNITSEIGSGRLGGMLRVRDSIIPAYLTKLDDMAAALVSRVNAQHAVGVDPTGTPGGDFFVPFVPAVPGSTAGAARSMELAITDPSKLAAAEAGAGPGSNANALSLAAIRDERLIGGAATVQQAYSDLVFAAGADSRTARDAIETQGVVLLQLQNQRDSLSSVSLDEEAVNIIRYQKAYEASARFISVLDGLTEEILRLVG
ncbi:MAG: flagellar hook-associated protein FlgK [Acidobacteria bacterium]|nr:flagellar hook-associated protein FlgK [Acidobacteriota bacterium]